MPEEAETAEETLEDVDWEAEAGPGHSQEEWAAHQEWRKVQWGEDEGQYDRDDEYEERGVKADRRPWRVVNLKHPSKQNRSRAKQSKQSQPAP
jgi:hypothetical protein